MGSSAPNMCAATPMYRFCGTWDSCDGVVVRAAIVAGCLFSNACLRRSFLGSRSYLFVMHSLRYFSIWTVISCCSLPFSPVVDLTACGGYCSGPVVFGHSVDSLSHASLNWFPIGPVLAMKWVHLSSSLPVWVLRVRSYDWCE